MDGRINGFNFSYHDVIGRLLRSPRWLERSGIGGDLLNNRNFDNIDDNNCFSCCGNP